MIGLTQLSKRKLEALTCPWTKFTLFLRIRSLPKSFLSSRLQNGFSCCSHGGCNVYWVQLIDSITPKMLKRVILNLPAFQLLQNNRAINFLFWKVILYFSNTRALKFREYALKIESTAELFLTMDIFGFRRAPDISKMLEFSGRKFNSSWQNGLLRFNGCYEMWSYLVAQGCVWNHCTPTYWAYKLFCQLAGHRSRTRIIFQLSQ